MIYIEANSTSAYYNFAAEYYFMAEKQLEDTVFMFWRTSPTVMVGRFQNTYAEVNLPYAQRQGIQVVRRLSGGGAIYTDMGGWQYTFIAPGGGQIEFLRFLRPVVKVLCQAGAPASFNGRNDLEVAGKKFSGNAQYISGGRTLHHGSILFNTDIEEMVRSTSVDEEKIISKGIKSVRERVANLAPYLPGLSMEAFKALMVSGLMENAAETYSLTEADVARIKEIEAQQFNNWQKIYGDSPKFALQKTKRFPAGALQCHLDVAGGIIREVKIYGDFFGDIDPAALCRSLQGCEYRRESLLPRLQAGLSEGSVYGITAEDFADALL